jgi:hypothetical protein
MDLNWEKIVGAVAPTIATALLGPLAGAAVSAIGGAVLGDENASEQDIAERLAAGTSPEILVRLREADNAFKLRLKELDLDLNKLNAAREAAYIADTASARTAHGGNPDVLNIGKIILGIFGATMGLTLWGSYLVLTKGITITDTGTAVAVASLIGSIVGYVAAQAQQVGNYLFGSSAGSKEKSEALSQAVQSAMQHVANGNAAVAKRP